MTPSATAPPSPEAIMPPSSPSPTDDDLRQAEADAHQRTVEAIERQNRESAGLRLDETLSRCLTLAKNAAEHPPPKVDPFEIRQEQERRERMLAWANIPEAFSAATLGDVSHVPPANRKQLAAIHGAMRGHVADLGQKLRVGPFIVLIGPAGTAKIHTIAATVRAAIDAGHAARYVTAAGLLIQLAEGERFGSVKSVAEVRREYIRPRLVVVDEIDKRNGTERNLNAIFDIVSERHAAGRTTILAGNMSREGMDEIVGPYLLNRTLDGGAVYEISGESVRGKVPV